MSPFSHACYRDLVEKTPVGIVVYCPNEIILANNAAVKILGATHTKELLGEPFTTFTPTKVWPRVKYLISDIIAKKSNFHFAEGKARRLDGTVFDIEISANYVNYHHKPAVQVFLQDISRRKEMERLLTASEERYRKLVELSPDAIVVHSRNKILFVNEAAIQLAGASTATQLLGRPATGFIPPSDVMDFEQATVRLLGTPNMIEPVEIQLNRLNGQQVHVEGRACQIIYQGQPAILVSIRDITSRKRIEAQQSASRLCLAMAERLAAAGIMATGLAHEINQPLSAIKTLADTMLLMYGQGSITWPEVITQVEKISCLVNRIDGIIDHIRRSVKQEQTPSSPCDVNMLIQKTIALEKVPLEEARIQVHTALAPNLPLVLGHDIRLEQAISNLLINARQALTHKALDRKTIICSTGFVPRQSQVCLTVSDNGPGIPSGSEKDIFSPYFTTKTVPTSMGLGLSIVHTIITSYGGRVTADNNDQGGATFSIYLPAYCPT